MELISSYNPALVSFSVFIAVLASYTALELTERISARKKIQRGWLLGSSLTMGTGVWSMHFVGMLAYSIGVPINYDITTVIISWMPAIVASGIAFYYLHRGFKNAISLIQAGTLMGSGIGAMHYIGMAAIRVPANMHYEYGIVALSVVFAVILSSVSLATANFVKGYLDREELKVGGSFLMGTAISGMHYIGMAAVGFSPTQNTPTSYLAIPNTGLAYTIGVVTIIIVAGAFMACMREQKQDLQVMAKKLRKSSASLKLVNQELEKRVAARTAELQQAKELTEQRHAQLKQAQRTAIEQNAKLKQARETALFRNAELKQARDEAVAASESKDIFLANITHELRTPLNSILGYTKLLQRDRNLTQNQIDDLAIIQQSGVHLLTLINDILDFAKNNAAKMELHLTAIELEKFLEGVMGIAKMWAQEKQLPLKLEIENSLPVKVEADEKRLRQVLINLLSNAVKFTNSGAVVLKVKVVEEIGRWSNEITQQKLRFEVVDTGAGMTAEELEKIFQPFEQVGDIPSRALGTGLGLSLSKQIVELMGGELKVKSEAGRGSTFWFEAAFPVLEVASTKPQPAKEPVTEASEIFGYEGKRRKLLVVDDKKENRDLLVKILQPLGFEVETANDGQQMLEMAAFIRPDLILLDLFMPYKTGFTSSKELRQKPGFENTPIVIVTASSITKEMGFYLDCEAILHKPVDEEELLSTLQRYLDLEWIYDRAS